MPKDKIKEIFTEYWNAIIEGLIIALLFVGFAEVSPIFGFLAVVSSLTDIVIIIHALVVDEDPEFLIVDLIIRWILKGGSK
jgi:hypothetical protein